MSEVEVFDTLKYRIEVDTRGTRWFYNSANQLHRTDGPAVEYTGGDKFWLQYGLLHSTDGPAIERANGTKEWFQNGEELTEAEFNQAVKNV